MAKFLNSTLLLIVSISLMAMNLGTAKADLFGIFDGIAPIAPVAPIAQVTVRGLLTCSVNAALPTAPPLVGVNVTLSCDGQLTTLGQAITNPSGFFEIVLSAADAVLFHPSSDCIVYAQLKPTLNCAVFPPTGVLQSSLHVLGVVGTVIGNVLRVTSIAFSLIHIA